VGAAQPSQAQEFRFSTVVLHTGDTLRGPCVMYLDRDLLLITMPDQTVRTVPAVAIRTFAVRGEVLRHGSGERPVRVQPTSDSPLWWYGTSRARQFLVYPWNRDKPNAEHMAPAFFERLNGGPYILLRRRNLISRVAQLREPVIPGGWPVATSIPRTLRHEYLEPRDQFYLATPEGTIVPLRRPRRDLLEYFSAEADQLEKLAKDQGMSFNDALHLAHMVDFVNELHRTQVSLR
jgi:hypothetical protein